jgi:nitrous oxide reductase accessory protein NosL
VTETQNLKLVGTVFIRIPSVPNMFCFMMTPQNDKKLKVIFVLEIKIKL